MSIKKKQVIVWMSVATVLVVAGAAWACTSQPRLLMVSPNRSPKAEAVRITGEGIVADQAAIIRWNTINGPKLAEVAPSHAGSFSTTITIPDASPGIYFILIETANGVGRAAFEVTAPGPEASDPASAAPAEAVRTDLWQGFSSINEVLQREPSQSSASSQQPGARSMGAGAFLAVAGLAGLAAFGAIAVRRRELASAGWE